ncbi:zinc finger CCHC-type and RNA-binding motif-containing protein 1-like [Ostrea edulis]|uniref:zinc finger CCHC-type and RNA-binding motif-containing protein 1-like n=1 Tax=Ostrea edulis TaxID=37623 RepID=UPI002095FFAF|nr:zinc finger CCHC-type and RNA-binding motif-containing protein 1-like [Ostrea edulis]
MSGGLAPSKSTVYVGNLPFSLTNNDIHKIFEKYGRVAKVTVLKDDSRRSKGVAFIMFIEKDSAYKAVRALNKTEMFGRTIKCNIAKDNGRTTDFIRRKNYPDKSRCYECGEEGHLSYKCPKNLLGEREPPPKKEKKRKKEDEEEYSEEEEESETEDPALESLSAAIKYQQHQMELESMRYAATSSSSVHEEEEPKRKKYKKDAYFSDEEEFDDG